ncbi:uncharacterized protein BT62DRAFT_1078042 [Guyanagaster necrorhizus]|uniref:Protein kinase domain-containing protein n=1 Tax=Guyanagaster necrorhizus TaxID=856835 RepID=A0A9P7VN52_9AGAR|nr:uncharacterized protein BT62DRAFT_1078042 [Guyanagaster necrorhizus MCA 3950]KAG7444253.1 hypothetical protein BT62DRAFT_1078042 [Guyanagaster necrorhizus MCA 3950]
MPIPYTKTSTISQGTTLPTEPLRPRLHSWIQIKVDDDEPDDCGVDIAANILVMDDLCSCSADFGFSLFGNHRLPTALLGCAKEAPPPEYMNSTLFDQSYITARDVYAYGCILVEVGPTVHRHHALMAFSQIFTGKPPLSDIKKEARVIHETLTNGSLHRDHPARRETDFSNLSTSNPQACEDLLGARSVLEDKAGFPDDDLFVLDMPSWECQSSDSKDDISKGREL